MDGLRGGAPGGLTAVAPGYPGGQAGTQSRSAALAYAANMASAGKPPKSRRTAWRRIADKLVDLTTNEAPKLVRAPAVQRGITQGIKIGLDVWAAGTRGSAPPIPAGRPVASVNVPTAQRARQLVYAPNLNGRADPGEIVWSWVAYAEDPGRGKDRPVLVVGRDHHTLLGLMLSSQQHHRDDPNWIEIGSGSWDYEGRISWVRLDRVLDVPEEGIRREGAILDRATFDRVATRLRADYSWS